MYLSIYLCIYLFIYLSIYLSIYSCIYHLPIPGALRNKLRLNLKFIFLSFSHSLSFLILFIPPSVMICLFLTFFYLSFCLFVIFLFLTSLPIKMIYALMKNDGIKSSNMHHLFQRILASSCSYRISSDSPFRR